MGWFIIGIYFAIGLAWGTYIVDQSADKGSWLEELFVILIFGAIWPVMLLVVHDD